MANLTLGAFNPNTTYQQVHAWQPELSSHCNNGNIFYLFLDATVKWQGSVERIYTIVMQYSSVTGQNLELQMPAHLLCEEALEISGRFYQFVKSREDFYAQNPL